MDTDLLLKRCVPCEGGVEPLKEDAIVTYMSYLKTSWDVVENKKIQRIFEFKYFTESIDFVNKVADLANSEGHHPDIHIFYNKVTIELWTHAIGGLSENDFILARKIETMLR